jgi:hypothetical protein
MSRTLWSLAALATLAMGVAGCGNGTQGGPAGTGDSTIASQSNGASSIHEKAVKFAECMRTNGVNTFPDPAASGSFTIDGVLNGSSLDPNSAAWKQAMGVCKNLQPPEFTGSKVTPQLRTARLRFAQCIRDNGVPDFPDPTANGPLVDTNRIPSAATPSGMTALNAAMHACRDFAAPAGVTGGR